MPQDSVKGLRTYDEEILSVLAFEFSQTDHRESERKIKRRLRDKKLGAYDQARVDLLRSFKDDLLQELSKGKDSSFYSGSRGNFADIQDWEFDLLLRHLQKKHSKIPKKEIAKFLPYAIYLYYLR